MNPQESDLLNCHISHTVSDDGSTLQFVANTELSSEKQRTYSTVHNEHISEKRQLKQKKNTFGQTKVKGGLKFERISLWFPIFLEA